MIQKIIPAFFCACLSLAASAQTPGDTTVQFGNRTITLSGIVVSNKLNVPVFIERIRNDSTFYKAFRSLHLIGFTAINDIRMNNKKGEPNATLRSITQQYRSGNCRKMRVLEETATGDFYDGSAYNYYTAQMYASLFFTKDSVCNESNTVAGIEFNTSGKSGMEKHKEQLKMLFFNPGRRINGLPFISNKTAIFDEDMAARYDMDISMEQRNNINCYVFHQKVKEGRKGDVVIDEMTTWFDEKTYEVLARNYALSYDAGVYDFDVRMEVELGKHAGLLVPTLLRYTGNWKAIFKKRERGVFTATLYDFH